MENQQSEVKKYVVCSSNVGAQTMSTTIFEWKRKDLKIGQFQQFLLLCKETLGKGYGENVCGDLRFSRADRDVDRPRFQN